MEYPGSISGEVVLERSLVGRVPEKAVLFILARESEGGPPVAVKRIPRPGFPFQFTLSQADVMLAGRSFEGKVILSARLDQDGDASTRDISDWEGLCAKNPVRVGNQSAKIVIRSR